MFSLRAACEASRSPLCLVASPSSSSSCLVCSDFFFRRVCSLAFSCVMGREEEGSVEREGEKREGKRVAEKGD